MNYKQVRTMHPRTKYRKETGGWPHVDDDPLDEFNETYVLWLEDQLEKALEQSPERVSVDAVVSGLKGEVVKIGEMYVDDELLTGMFVEISREEFLEQDANYLYQKVKIKKEAH